MYKKDIWVGRLLLITCLISNKHPCYFENKHTHFKTYYNYLKHFQKTNVLVYILTNENHYKDFLNEWPLFKNTFKKPHKA